SMINAGEVGGSLPLTLGRLAELMRRQVEVRERIRSALVYPALLACVVLFTLVVLLAFVLPRFEALFAESEAPLPLSTQVVLALGRFVANYWLVILAVTAALFMSFTYWVRSSRGREQFDRWILVSRLTFGIPAATNTARLLRTVSTLCANGLPLPSALRVARGTLSNRRLLRALSQVASDVQEGSPFSASMARAAVFPPVAVQLARVGEETGKLDQMLQSAAMVLEEESHLRLERLLGLAVPLLTIAMGIIVAGLIGSVLIGLLSINDLAF
ncbi:MAG: type II secretion system F family protein, partial [Gammaproteobacteria bacterium]